MAKITAYRKDTGEKVRIPEHWIGHPELGEPFRKTKPTARSAEAQPDGDAPTTTKAANAAAKGK